MQHRTPRGARRRGKKTGETMRTLTAAAMGLVMILGAATHAAADCDKTARFVASPAGKVIAADGRVRVRAQTRTPTFVKQNYVLEMSALVANGTTFMVFNNGLPAGTVTINFGVGRLALDNEAGHVLPAGTDPVCSIRPVVVTDANGTVILSGSF